MIMFIVESLDNDEDKALILDIYEKYSPWLMSRAYRLTQDYETSSDLVHDCIVKLIKHVDKLQTFNDCQLRAYLAVAIDNITKNYLIHSSKVCLIPTNEDEIFSNIPEENQTEDIVEHKFNLEAIRENLKKLPERDQNLIRMKYGLELEDSEIAPMFGISEKSVKMTVYRSVKKLQKKVKENQ